VTASVCDLVSGAGAFRSSLNRSASSTDNCAECDMKLFEQLFVMDPP
jgi:hypothetical protein